MKRNRAQVFEAQNSCSDEEFVHRCGFDLDSPDAATALAIRRILADLAGVRAESICPEHTYRHDLVGLGQLDSLDQVEFVMRLEESLGRCLEDKLVERFRGIRDDELYDPTFTVRDTVQNVLRSLNQAEPTRPDERG